MDLEPVDIGKILARLGSVAKIINEVERKEILFQFLWV